jgi:deoxyhypusine synthase
MCGDCGITPLVAKRVPIAADFRGVPVIGGKIRAMTVKEHLQQVVADMSEDEAADALALVAGARAGATPTDVYGTAWGKVLADTDPETLAVTGESTITIPDGIPDVS